MTDHATDQATDHATDLFAPLQAGGPELETLRARLADRAEADGLLDVSYRTLDSPVGPLLLAATPLGLVRVAFAVEGHDAVLADLADRIGPRVLHATRPLDAAAHAIEGYLAGQVRAFDLPLDLRLAHGFRREAIGHLRDIDYGHTASYAALAALAGRPTAVRAAASACATNPLPLVLPCHRVVRADGSLGRYLGGEEVKAQLIALEADTLAGGTTTARGPGTHAS